MRRVENPKMSRRIIQHLAELYNIREKREGIHLSTLVGCRTRSFLDSHQVVVPTDKEVLFFAAGWGLQDVMTPKDAATPVYEKDGITYSPDMQFMLENTLVEMKTTRMSSKRLMAGLPESWIEYMKGGCYIQENNKYELAVYLLVPAEVYCETIYFDDDELFENWEDMLARKAVYELALSTNKAPTPFQHCKEWECKNCRYKMICEGIDLAEKQIAANSSTPELDKTIKENPESLWD